MANLMIGLNAESISLYPQGLKGALIVSLVSGICRDKSFLFELKVILLIEWQSPSGFSFYFGGRESGVNLWEMLQSVEHVGELLGS